MKILRFRDYPEVPWKNGQGITRDILRSPDNSEQFDWGLSLADLERSSAFSAFSGYDRTITPINGHGFTLSFEDGHVETLDTLNRPYSFDGGAALRCDLLDGKCQVFNLKVRRNTAAATWQIRDLGAPLTLDAVPHTAQMVFALGDGVTLDTGTGNPHTLDTWDCAVWEDGAAVTLGASRDKPTFFHATIKVFGAY